MAVVDTLHLWGILRPEITAAAARDAGLELAAACVVLMKETGGGRMVWGSDGRPHARRTDVAGNVIYEFGGPVTPANYLRFRAAQRAGIIPRQGIGDCQLTSEDYVAAAEHLGGATGPADPYCNQRAGFAGLARLQARYGIRDGFVAYNGGPGAIGKRADHPAQIYGDKSVAQFKTWRTRLGGANTSPTPDLLARAPVEPVAVPTPRSDDPMSVIEIQRAADGSFRGAAVCEAGASSSLVDRAWVVVGLVWGGTADVLVSFLDDRGLVMPAHPTAPGQKRLQVSNNRRLVADVPDGAVLVTVEGHASVGSVLTAAVLAEPK